MDRSAAVPYVVVFYYAGDELHARVRDVRTQDQWLVDDAKPLLDLLERSNSGGDPKG